MRVLRAALGTLAACAAVLALAGTASASYQRPFVEVFGSAAEPTFEWPSLVAVDPSTGDLLVGDFKTSSISRFKPNGEPDPFPALGTNVIDGKRTGAANECPTVPADCDQTPQNGLEVSSAGGSNEQIAVSPTSGEIFVTQKGTNLVDIFSAEGAYLGQLKKAGTKSLVSPKGITVDAAGAIYVSQNNSEISKYVPSSNPPVDGDNEVNFKITGYGVSHLAIGSGSSAGEIFAGGLNSSTLAPLATLEVDAETGAFHVYAEGFSPLVTVDPTSGNPVIQSTGNKSEAAEFDGSEEAAESPLSRLLFEEHGTQGMRDFVANSSGDVYVVTGPADPRVFVYGEPAIVPTVAAEEATEITTTSATLQGTVNPEETETTECFFEWGTTTSYGETAPCEPEAGELPEDAEAHEVQAPIGGLLPNGHTYHYRLAARNENGIERSADRTLKTEFTAQTEPATEITRSGATLNGTVRPEGEQYEECFFEWGLASNQASYENTAECEPEAANIPPGAEAEAVSAPITGLTEATRYRFRLFAKSPGVTQEAKELTFTTAGPPVIAALRSSGATQAALTLEAEINPSSLETTYQFEWGLTAAYGHLVSGSIEPGTEAVRVTAPLTGLSPASTYHYRVVATNAGGTTESEDQLAETLNSCGLPEGRCMELVSPRELGPVAAPGHNPGKGIYAQPASQGGSFLYQVDTGLPDASKGGAVTYLGTRGPTGWSSAQYSPAITERVETSPYANPSAIAAASPDLGCSVLISSQLLTGDPVAKIAAEMGAASLYRRSPDGTYTLISELVPEGPNVTSTRISDEYKVIGMSEDCGRVVFETRKQYPGIPGEGEWRLYEWEEGAIRNVGWVPKEGGEEEAAEAVAGQYQLGAFEDHYNAVSADASRIFFTAKRKAEKVAGETGTTGVFVRIDASETLDVSASETATPDSGATFQGATPDGKRVYFVANAGLTTSSNSEGRDLYECEIVEGGGGEAECELTDLSVNSEGGEAKVGVLLGSGQLPSGLTGVAADGSRAYFIAQGQLDPGQGPSQAENEAAKSYSLYEVETESGDIIYVATIAGSNASKTTLGGTTVTARASASGRYLLFESSARVTDYDSGGLEQAYLYDAEAGSGEAPLACVTCRQDGGASVNTGAIGTQPLLGDSLAVRGGEALAFFKSRDALAAGAVEGEWSLYEWAHGQVFKIATEKPGVSVPNFIGTLKYIGTNADATDLYFFDSAALNWENPEGRDAAWDARIGGGFAEPAAPPPGCDPGVESSCQGPGSPAPGAPPAAGSASFTGPGNAKPRKHKKHKKAHKKHRRRHHHKKRRGHGKKHKAGKHKKAHKHKRKRSSR